MEVAFLRTTPPWLNERSIVRFFVLVKAPFETRFQAAVLFFESTGISRISSPSFRSDDYALGNHLGGKVDHFQNLIGM